MTGRAIKSGFIRLTAAMNAVASVWYFVVMVLVTSDVIGRSLFNSPITGTPEIVKISVVGMFFIQLPNAVWKGRLIRSDIVLNRLSPRLREALVMPIELMGLIFCLILVTSLWPDTVKAWSILEFEGEGALRVPTYPSYTFILLGGCLAGVLFIARFVGSLNRFLGKAGPGQRA
jgi:TRAP-type C4-dicarboxylate transport system permease small subunit